MYSITGSILRQIIDVLEEYTERKLCSDCDCGTKDINEEANSLIELLSVLYNLRSFEN